MAGHSKWANIKHRKAAQDARRSKVWTRIIKEITVAARDGGGDIASNPTLRLAVQNAKGANLPKDTIERAIKKGVGGEGANLQPINYEGYGPNGIAIFVETMTDNLNRTVANIRSIYTKSGGSLGTNGSLSFIFDQKGVFTFSKENIAKWNAEELELELIEGGAEEIEPTDEGLSVTVGFEDFGMMQKKLEEIALEATSADLQRIPTSTTALDVESAKKVLATIEKFEEDDDVTNVYHNLELTDDLLNALNAQ
ncbi:MAG: YebC/PmpR family DNA-binding transcriptional regulator [Flavobacteriales bacterium]|nr:YebC/PmpR family DNA-binding transcriptional regulator [Flavobacteriales bacterium]